MSRSNGKSRACGAAKVSLAMVLAAGLGTVPVLTADAEEATAVEVAGQISNGEDYANDGTTVTTGVANMNGVSYDTLASAFKAVPEDGNETTIKLTADADVSSTIQVKSGMNVKLDLNGHAITVSRFNFNVQGTLCIDDSSTELSGCIMGTAQSSSRLFTVIGGTLRLQNGSISTEKTYALQAQRGTVEITGGTVTSAKPIEVQFASTVKILGGAVESTGDEDWAISVVTGSEPLIVIGAEDTFDFPIVDGLISIPGGAGDIQLIGGTIGGVSGSLPAGGTYTSRFKSNISGSLPVGSYCVQKDGYWIVTDQAPEGAVAAIGGKTYDTLQAAIEDADGKTVTLLANVRENIVIEDGSNVALNLNGCKLSSADDLQSGHGTITVNIGGTLVINDSAGGSVDTTVNGTGALVNYGAVTVNGGSFTRSAEGDGNTWYTVDNQGTMTFAGGMVSNNSRTSSLVRNLEGVLTISGGTFESEHFTALKNDSGGQLDITGGTVRSTFGQCVQNWNEARISGGEFYGGAVATWSQPNTAQGGLATGKTTISDDAVIYGNVEAYNYLNATIPAVVEIKGGVVKGEIKKYDGDEGEAKVVDISNKGSTITVSGGVFTHAPADVLLAEDTRLVHTDEGYVPVGDTVVAMVGTQSYTSLASAVESVANGQTVTLCGDATESITVQEDKTIILDLAGYTLTNTQGQHTITNKGTLTVMDSSAGKTGVVDNTSHQKAAIFNDVSGTATLNGGTFNRSEENGASSTQSGGNSFYTLQNYGAMTINDGTTVRQGDSEEGGKFSSLIENGWYNGNDNTSKQNATMVINGGSFVGGLNTIKNDDWGVLTINGGSFTNTAQAVVLNWNVTTIVGGTFESEQYAVLNGRLDDVMDKGVLTITGGSFTGGDGFSPISQMDGSDSIGTVSVSGGSFWAMPDDSYLADGFEIVKNPDGTFGVQKEHPSVPSIPSKPSYGASVAETENGTVKLSPERATAGTEVTVTATPDEGFEVAGVAVTDKDGEAIEVTANEDGTWSFEMPTGGATVTVFFACDGGELCPSAHLVDVDQDLWYHAAIDWAVEAGVMTGYDDGSNTFGPEDALTRAQLAQVLYNQAGKPDADVADAAAFADCAGGAWYAKAIAWASSEGLMTGYDDGSGRFGPDDVLSREQLAVVFWRLAGSPEADADLSEFPDGADTSAWAEAAVEWAVSTGLIEGYAHNGELGPTDSLTRAQMATVLMREAQDA